MFDELKPIYEKILVKRDKAEEKTEGGLFIPDDGTKKTNSGTVIATGQGRLTAKGEIVPLTIKVGDLVVFNQYSGIELDEDYMVLREDDIYGKL